jgi:hypothetical protein
LLYFLNLDSLTQQFFTNCTHYAIDKIITSPLNLTITTKTQITFATLDDKLLKLNTIQKHNTQIIETFENTTVLADHKFYNIVDKRGNDVHPLFPLNFDVRSGFGNMHLVIRPVIVAISSKEFLVVTGNAGMAIGIFVSSTGDPVRGTLQWPAAPISLGKFFYFYLLLDRINGT